MGTNGIRDGVLGLDGPKVNTRGRTRTTHPRGRPPVSSISLRSHNENPEKGRPTGPNDFHYRKRCVERGTKTIDDGGEQGSKDSQDGRNIKKT